MYYVGIDISKYKHDCSILDQSGNTVVDDFVFANSFEGFDSFKTLLSSLASPEEIKIGFEATGHYTSNLKRFLENAHYSFMESNPALISKYIHAQTLRRTKNDALDSRSIARFFNVGRLQTLSKGILSHLLIKVFNKIKRYCCSSKKFVCGQAYKCFRPYFS